MEHIFEFTDHRAESLSKYDNYPVRFDFHNLDREGLQPLLNKFKKRLMSVTRLTANNVAKRTDGVVLKNFTMEFFGGQKVQIFVKSDGTIFQIKVP